MIKARHNKIARFIFNIYLNNLFKKNFGSFNQIGEIPKIDLNLPIVVFPNHFSWWDGFFIDYLSRIYFPEHKFYIVMLEKQLQKFWFFNKLGAIGFEPSNPKSLVKLKEYINDIISKDEKSFIAFYPQGKIQLYDDEIKFKEGVKFLFLKNLEKVNFLTVAFKIQYFEQQKPDIFFSIKTIDDKTILENIDKFTEFYLDFFNDFNNKAVSFTISRKLF
ncbi:MAG: 1-acyl-sn-glycerol-3-phosphate acyltransferase [Candidatus Kapaibacteriota bacterium]